MRYVIHGYYYDEPRQYLANSIGDKLYIQVAGAWRSAIWYDGDGGGYKCYYPNKRWNPPFLFIRVRAVEKVGEGIWESHKKKLKGEVLNKWFVREQACYKEVKKTLKKFEVVHLSRSTRFMGYGDILILEGGCVLCAIDVVGMVRDRKNRFLIQTRHKNNIEWKNEMENKKIKPFYAFLLNGDLIPKRFNYLPLTEEVIDRFFRTRKGVEKKTYIDFTNKNLWGDRDIPTTARGWNRINKNFYTVTELRGFVNKL